LTNLGGTALGDIALVPAPFLRQPRGVRDIAEWYMTVASRPDYVHAVFSRQCDLALENLARLHQAVGNAIDVLFLCGTDFGTQTSQFLSAATYRDLYHPYYRRMNDWIHAHTTWKTFKHSCGAVRPLIEDLIASGFDVLNPVQCSATDMDPAALKAAYGDRLVFWGGGIDTQHTLPFGQPRDVQAEALERCRVFGPGGGFVFNPVHNVQARTPIENLVAMFNGLREYNGQPPLRKG
ncbi:MAG: methyltransferase, partial [Candidatus Marinimicrobia bacterium]|nr:methyltransferase [Candidatus Neomarinimicrobiota bacterium]